MRGALGSDPVALQPRRSPARPGPSGSSPHLAPSRASTWLPRPPPSMPGAHRGAGHLAAAGLGEAGWWQDEGEGRMLSRGLGSGVLGGSLKSTRPARMEKESEAIKIPSPRPAASVGLWGWEASHK